MEIMKNRAKCKLCEDIIESLNDQDYQLCRCGEIFVDGGKQLLCGANDWSNFIRIDDAGNEIVPTIEETEEVSIETEISPIERREKLLSMFKNLIDSFDNLPTNGRVAPITHYDLQSALVIIYELIKDIHER